MVAGISAKSKVLGIFVMLIRASLDLVSANSVAYLTAVNHKNFSSTCNTGLSEATHHIPSILQLDHLAIVAR